MKCPECVRTGRRSRFYTDGFDVTTTAAEPLPYYDADGRLHRHVRNTTRTGWHCSNGHYHVRTMTPSCPNALLCAYDGRDDWELQPEQEVVNDGSSLVLTDSRSHTLTNKTLSPAHHTMTTADGDDDGSVCV